MIVLRWVYLQSDSVLNCEGLSNIETEGCKRERNYRHGPTVSEWSVTVEGQDTTRMSSKDTGHGGRDIRQMKHKYCHIFSKTI